ncbi:hypothetical protein MC7420_2990 [Coleofasciculus chthonoplastes PCC 7420]|uniref:Uncharacterized protein n=1 Tax=Coleofasciculus chthonoplastes PCC 7420 TaxID=118168 RepID=B4VK18_9CYAN|nr:hypothetical protein [Coleofasciculus chthonoplastes]EDX77666.1 hypothetical protein MC7420_2990 [Coleofasciculus chthonoplastes PCC 7420]
MKNLSLTLYAFHLRQTLTDAPDRVADDAALLWDNLTNLGHFPGLTTLKSQLICYTNTEYTPQNEPGQKTYWLTHAQDIDLGAIPTADGFKITANLQPFRLNDTYAIDLTLTPDSPHLDITIPQLQHFRPESLLPATIQASLGQTLWVYAEVDAQTDCASLAEQCATALLANTSLNPSLQHQGILFGSHLFEYLAKEPSEPNNPAKECHILISLNNTQSPTPKLAAKAHDWLMQLLCCHHKLRYIYHQSRQRYPDARHLYSQLEQQIQTLPNLTTNPQTRLDALKNLLNQIPPTSLKYSRCLRDLRAHQTAIETDITNLEECQTQIKAIGNIPQFWGKFLKESHVWKQQIQTDINYLSPGQDLFGQMLETVRGIVDLDQAQRDTFRRNRLRQRALDQKLQNLELWIAVVGTGLAVSGISSQVDSQPIQTFLQNQTNSETPVCPGAGVVKCTTYNGLNILIHIIIAFAIALPIGLILRQIRHPSK